MKLPTTKTGIKQHLHEYNTLIYGSPKIGKSSFCAQIDGMLFLATEPGLNSQNVFQVEITSWREMWEAYDELKKGRHNYKAIAIDTVDIAYRLCCLDACKKLRINHKSDLDFGKAYDVINDEYLRFITALGSLPYGLFLISHSAEKKLDRKKGGHTVIIPSLPGKAANITCDFSDFILFFDNKNGAVDNPDEGDEYERVIRTAKTRFYVAGSRLKGMPETIPLEFSEFEKAFNIAMDKVKKEELLQPGNTQQPQAGNNVTQMTPTKEQIDSIQRGIKQLVDPGGRLSGEALAGATNNKLSLLTKGNVRKIDSISNRKIAHRILELIDGEKLETGVDDAGADAASGGA